MEHSIQKLIACMHTQLIFQEMKSSSTSLLGNKLSARRPEIAPTREIVFTGHLISGSQLEPEVPANALSGKYLSDSALSALKHSLDFIPQTDI